MSKKEKPLKKAVGNSLGSTEKKTTKSLKKKNRNRKNICNDIFKETTKKYNLKGIKEAFEKSKSYWKCLNSFCDEVFEQSSGTKKEDIECPCCGCTEAIPVEKDENMGLENKENNLYLCV